MITRKRAIRIVVILVIIAAVGVTMHLVGSSLIPALVKMHGG